MCQHFSGERLDWWSGSRSSARVISSVSRNKWLSGERAAGSRKLTKVDERFGRCAGGAGDRWAVDYPSVREASRRRVSRVSHSLRRKTSARRSSSRVAGLARLTVEEHARCEEKELPNLTRRLRGTVLRRLAGDPCGPATPGRSACQR